MNEADIFDHTIAALEAFGLKVRQQKRTARDAHAHAWLRIEKDKQHVDYVVEVRRTLPSATLGAVVARLRQTAARTARQPLLVVGHVTPPVAQKLHALEQPFADTAGNAYLTGTGILIMVAGRKPAQKPKALRDEGKAFTAAGLKVLFALICDPALAEAPHRAIAAAANVALGTVPAVLADLQKHGFMATAGRTRRFYPNRRLLDNWAIAYARTLRPKTLIRVVLPDPFDNWKDWNPAEHGMQWGGEAGGALLTNYLRPGELTVYGDEFPGVWLAKRKMRAPPPGGGTRLVELRRRFWGKTLKHPDGVPADIVPPALVYADLLATGDGRCVATAEQVYETRLARLFPAH